jgi:hypothetical protein
VKRVPLRSDPDTRRAFIDRGRASSARSLRRSRLPDTPDGPKPPVAPRGRDWVSARAKVDDEGRCRVSRDCQGHIEAAHVIGREHDRRVHLPGRPDDWWFEVDAASIAPLCRHHHKLYDAHRLDLLPFLTVEEQTRAVADAGGIELARRRTAPLSYERELEALGL